ncbi:MAG: DUF1549 and DUF1553 domain-containing protein [Planctomycetota bacterium]
MPSAPFVAAVVVAVCCLSGGAAAQSSHWAYRPIVRPAVPAVAAADAAFVRSPLDALAVVAMRAHGLSPAAPAAPAVWLRRVALDLTGLPPTVAEVAAFEAECARDAAAARERAVDRLLQSPGYAERWTQWWLDLARYADSQGYEKDALRPTMWRYRDWVLGAFARDLPFDRFTIEQLAGDLLPDANDETRLATAFHRQTMTNTEGGTDDEEFRVAAVVDRVDTTMSVWMGSTLGCAQCHDHKYDPFAQREFFQLFAFFDQTEDHDQPDDAPVLRVPTVAQQARAKVLELELADARAALAAATAAAPQLAVSTWQRLGPIEGRDLRHVHDERFAPERDGVQLDAEQDGQRWQPHPEYRDGVVHTWSGDRSAFYLQRTIAAPHAGTLQVQLGSDDALVVWWNGAEVLRRFVARGAQPGQEQLELPLREGRNDLLLKVSNGSGPGGFCCELVADPAQAKAAQRVRTLEAEFDAQRGPQVPVLRELPADRRRTTRIHRRGSFLDQGDVVTPGVPAVFPPLPASAAADRLAFARWLMASDNPLTARVLANRVFAELFGQGLVPTLEDFGTQGDLPSHPELLDWLAREFADSGWSLRRLLRTLVLSATYGQSSAFDERARELDPTNRWLARGPAVRLSAETLRDQALAVAGLLTPTIGGPSVMPPQPDGVWLQIYSGERWREASGPDRYRRALYTFWRRTSPHPAMLVFDAMSREACVLRRQRTNTPLQALVLWNEPCFREAAEGLAAAVQRELPQADDAARVRALWQRCLLRAPSAAESARLLQLLADERARGRAAAEASAGGGRGGNGGDDDAFAWSVLAGVVLSLDEFVTKR